MKQLITTDRIRAIIAQCQTPQQVRDTLKSHKIKYQADRNADSKYNLDITIPTKTGKIRVYRTISRRDPFRIQQLTTVLFQPASIPATHCDPFTSI